MTTDALIGWVEGCPDLLDIVRAVPPTWAGVLPSELLAMLVVLRGHGITHVVESGRYDGTSTEALLSAGMRVDSIERTPKQASDARLRCSRLTLHTGDGSELAPTLVKPGSALLVDGPKGRAARSLAERCGVLTFLHDFHRRQPARAGLEAWFSDDAEWTEFSRHLDAEYWGLVRSSRSAWKRGPHTSGGGSYGPTLAIVA